VLIAKQVATLDVISAGRVSLGVGIGARVEDYRAVGVPFDAKRLKRMEAQIALMRRVWAGENVVEGALRPVERSRPAGGPELLAGALVRIHSPRRPMGGRHLRIQLWTSAEEIGFAYKTARQAWREAGRGTAPRLVMSFWFALGDRAREQLDVYLERYLCFLGDDVAKALAPTVTTTSAAALRDAARMLADLGPMSSFSCRRHPTPTR